MRPMWLPIFPSRAGLTLGPETPATSGSGAAIPLPTSKLTALRSTLEIDRYLQDSDPVSGQELLAFSFVHCGIFTQLLVGSVIAKLS